MTAVPETVAPLAGAVIETVGGVVSEVLSVMVPESRKGTNARHWSLEQLRMWGAWFRR